MGGGGRLGDAAGPGNADAVHLQGRLEVAALLLGPRGVAGCGQRLAQVADEGARLLIGTDIYQWGHVSTVRRQAHRPRLAGERRPGQSL